MPIASWIRLIALAAIWGGSFLFLRVAVPVLGAIPVAFSRVALATAGLGLLVALAWPAGGFRGRLGATLALGVIGTGVPFLSYAWVALTLPAGYLAILNATTPLMGALLGALFFHDPLTRARGAGITAGILGVGVLTGMGPVTPNAMLWWGVAACLLSTTSYALSTFLTRNWISQRGGLDSRLVAFGSQVGATLMLLPLLVGDLLTTRHDWSATPAGIWGAVLVLGLICTALAYILFYRLIADIGPVKASSVTFLIPLFGVFWGAVALDEPITWAHGAGGGLIGVALWLILRGPATRPPKRLSSE